MADQYDYDLLTIGAGSGGVRASRVAAAHGARVAVAEEHRVGGTCVIRGCVPKKLLIHGAHFAEDLADARRFGWNVPDCEFNWTTLRDNVLSEVDRLNAAYTETLTNHGVTIGTLRALGLDLDRDGRVTENDLRRLTRDQAADIFLTHYFRRPRIDALPEALQPSVFDMQVNAGGQAVKILQRLVTDMGFETNADGAIGPKTVAVVRAAAQAAPRHIADAYAVARRNYYYALADARPASRKFACRRDGGKGGWIIRAEEFMAPRFHLTEAEHRERTKTWA